VGYIKLHKNEVCKFARYRWNKYGFYKNIVNENMKMQLLHLYKANEFLKFKEIEINGTSVTNG